MKTIQNKNNKNNILSVALIALISSLQMGFISNFAKAEGVNIVCESRGTNRKLEIKFLSDKTLLTNNPSLVITSSGILQLEYVANSEVLPESSDSLLALQVIVASEDGRSLENPLVAKVELAIQTNSDRMVSVLGDGRIDIISMGDAFGAPRMLPLYLLRNCKGLL